MSKTKKAASEYSRFVEYNAGLIQKSIRHLVACLKPGDLVALTLPYVRQIETGRDSNSDGLVVFCTLQAPKKEKT